MRQHIRERRTFIPGSRHFFGLPPREGDSQTSDFFFSKGEELWAGGGMEGVGTVCHVFGSITGKNVMGMFLIVL